MAQSLSSVARMIADSKIPTTLFLGAGASIPSGGMTADGLADVLRKEFFPGERQRPLSEIASRAEYKYDRKRLVEVIRRELSTLKPSDSVAQLPRFNFKDIFTTNYDTLVETAYKTQKLEIPVVKSDRDWGFDSRQYNTILYKLHGCLTEDRADGLPFGMIITDEDYSTYARFRSTGFKQFEQSLATTNVVFIGYSLADTHFKSYVDEALKRKDEGFTVGSINLVLFEEDEIEAGRWTNRGINVSFGDLDRFLAALSAVNQDPGSVSIFSPVSSAKRHVIASEISSVNPSDMALKGDNLDLMISGSPATYADIRAGYAFKRSAESSALQQILDPSQTRIHVLLGPSGTGKTSTARAIITSLMQSSYHVYEHKSNIPVDLETWKDVEADHRGRGQKACVFFDEPNASQFAINQLCDYVHSTPGCALTILISYHPNIWSYRTKSPALVKHAAVHDLSRLTPADIDSVASHVRSRPRLASILTPAAQPLTHREIRDLIRSKATSDLFVSLKYLFERKSLDEIILKEFDQLGREQPSGFPVDIRGLYEMVCFLETIGVHVHRQMVLRLVGLEAGLIAEALKLLDGIVFEQERDALVEGIYIWRTRHPRIARIIAESKFSASRRYETIKAVVKSINSASKVERQFCSQLCNSDLGIESLGSEKQTELYRELVSMVPGERVPRHRLIRNLIKSKSFGEAEGAISDARSTGINDSVVHRYDAQLNVEKAKHLDFLEDFDRVNLLETAIAKAQKSISRRNDDMYSYEMLCRATQAYAETTGDVAELEGAVETLKKAYESLGDGQMLKWIGSYSSEIVRLKTHIS